MRIVKWALVVIILLLVASVAAGYFILSSYDFNNVKPEISRIVMQSTGRELRLGGDIEIEIGLTPILVIEDVGFKNAAWGSRDEMIRINRLEVQVELLPLIKKKIKIRKFVLVGPDILIETNSSGNSNFEMMSTEVQKPMEPSQKKAEEGFNIPLLTFNNLEIDNGIIRYLEGKSGKRVTLRVDKLQANAQDPESSVNLEVIGVYNEEKIDLRGNFGPVSSIIDARRPWPFDFVARVGAVNISAKGKVMDCLKASGLDLGILIECQSILDIAKLAGKNDIPDLGPVKLSSTISDQSGKLSLDNIAIDAGSEELILTRLSGSVKDIMGKGGLDIKFELKGKKLSGIEKITDYDVPIEESFLLSGTVLGELNGPYDFSDVNISIGQNSIKGSVKVDPFKKSPSIDADLITDKMDLRTFINNMDEKENPKKPKEKRKDKVFPDDPLHLDVLKLADVDIRFKAGKFLLPKMALDDLEIYSILNNGYLSIKNISGVIGGGLLKGDMEIHQENEETIFKTSLAVEHMDIGLMIKDLEVGDIAEGLADMDMNLEGRGRSIAGIMGKLKGKIFAVSGNGKINNNYIELIGGDLSSMLLRLLDPSKEEKGYTELNCFVAGFNIVDGIAESSAIVLDTGLMSVIGQGNVNLKTEELDFSVNPSPKQGFGGGILSKLSINLGELAKPLKLSGTLAEPKLALDATQTSIAFGKMAGGVMLFGPIGIAAALAGGTSGDENPCLSAIEAAKKGVKIGNKKVQEKDSLQNESTGEPVKALKDKIEGLGGAIKGLFK